MAILRARVAVSPAGVAAAALVVSALALWSAPGAAGAPGKPARLGPAPAGTELQIVLPLNVDAAGLERFALAVSNPGSPLYGRYESVAQLARRFGASRSARMRVISYLRSAGADQVSVDATGLLAEATLTAGLAERIFRTPLGRFNAVNGGRYVAPSRTPSIPGALRGLVAGVVGLDTRKAASQSVPSRERFARTPASRATSSAEPTARGAAIQPPSTQPRTGTPAGCAAGMSAGEENGDPTTAGFTPNQYLGAYDFAPLQNARVNGQGERVALVEIDGFTRSDISTFAQCFGLPVPPITQFNVGVSQMPPPGGEATLDLEVLDAAAPGLSGIDVYETSSDPASVLKALLAPVENRGRKPQVVSASLGLCEQDQIASSGTVGIGAAERLLELATATGVSYLASSGDSGSADCTDSSGNPRDMLAVNYPASSWWVTGVGGTNLELTAANQIRSQLVWNDTIEQVAAGGGGASRLFRRPQYQDGTIRTGARAVPDVSMLADLVPGYAIYCTAPSDCVSLQNGLAPWQTIGGTSAATPLLAGGIALIDQVLRTHGRADLGLANPLLYRLGRSSARGAVFGDVKLFGNDVGPYLPTSGGQPLGCCSAKVGFDEASGWGSVDMAHFAQKAIGLVAYILASVRLALPEHQRPLAQRSIRARVGCSRACYMAALANVQFGRRSFVVESKAINRPTGATTTIKLVFSSSQRRSLAAAHAKHARVLATIYGLIVDPEGVVQRRTTGRKLLITS